MSGVGDVDAGEYGEAERAADVLRHVVDARGQAGQLLTVWEIWTTVTDQHHSAASYAAIRDYIRSRRLAGQTGT
jgi:hypothetical protein